MLEGPQSRSKQRRPTKRRAESFGVGPGLGIDYLGQPVVDPTENVKALSEAQGQRQDDLRDLNNLYLDARIKAMEQIAVIRDMHSKEIRDLETRRLDAIRQVDVLAVGTAADRAQAAIRTLEAVAAANAETLRNAVTAAASTMASQLKNTVDQITERIGSLEKSSYEGKGKQTISEPQMERLTMLVEKLASRESHGEGRDAGISLSWAVLIAAAMGMIALLSVFLKR